MPSSVPPFAHPNQAAAAERLGAWFDHGAADAAVEFFPKYLRHTEGEWAGHPFVLADWQADRIIRPAFGWKRKDNTRLYRIIWGEIPRRNGKTELAAGVSLLALTGDAEYGGQAYSMAVDKDQAKIVFNKAGVMIGFSDALKHDLEVFKTSIYCAALAASFKPLSGKIRTKHGFSVSFACGDEVHEWPDGELADVVHKGTGSRRQPLEFYITTAGVHGQGFAWEQHEYAVKILNGAIDDPEFLPVIFAAQGEDPERGIKGDDWKDPATWAKANPNLGVSPKLSFIESECRKAQESPRLENNFKRFHLNLWTQQITRWLPMDKWSACKVHPVPLESLRGRVCYGGLDLSSTTDITALVLVAMNDDDSVDVCCKFWIPGGTKETRGTVLAARKKKDRAPFDLWVEQGWIAATEGNVVDYDRIRLEITGAVPNNSGKTAKDLGIDPVIEVVNLKELAIDRWNATQLMTQLGGDGVTMVPFGQGYASMSGPSKDLEKRVLAGTLNHGDNPVLRWMASNVCVEQDAAENIKPTKDPKKASGRIDGIVALIMALGRANVNAIGGEDLNAALERRGLVEV